MIEHIEKYPVATITLVCLLMLCCAFPYLEVSIMEARNFITAREMITDSNWLLTTMNGEPRYQKPPLPTWLTAFSGMILGIKNVFALRLPGIIMVILLGTFLFRLSDLLLENKVHALRNALILVTSFYVFAIVIEAPWDIFTHTFMFIGIFYLYKLLNHTHKHLKNAILSGLFIGFSIMCKGPVSLYALFLPFLIAYGISFKYSELKKRKGIYLITTVLIALIIGGWWYLYICYADPEAFLKITSKETGNWTSYNVRPFYYYWNFFIQSGLWAIPAFIALLYPYLKTRVSNLKVYKLTFWWTIAAVILLSLIPEKKSRYLTPVIIPLALNTGFYIDYLIKKFNSIKDEREIIPVYINFGLIALICFLFGIGGYIILKDFDNINWIRFGLAVVIFVAIGVVLVKNLVAKKIDIVFYATILFIVSAFVILSPISKDLKSDSYAPVTDLYAQTLNDNLMVYGLNNVSPEIIWQYGNKIPPLKINDSTYNVPNENRFGLLTGDSKFENDSALKNLYNVEFIRTYNLNTASSNSKLHRSRLVNHYYILTQK